MLLGATQSPSSRPSHRATGPRSRSKCLPHRSCRRRRTAGRPAEGGRRCSEAGDRAVGRDPAFRVPLDNLEGVAHLLRALRRAGAKKQATALARRAADHAPIDHGFGVAHLLSAMWMSGEKVRHRAGPPRRPSNASRRPRWSHLQRPADRPAGGGRRRRGRAPIRRAADRKSSTTLQASPQACVPCGRRAQMSRSPHRSPAISPPTPPSTTRAASPCFCKACGRRRHEQVAAPLARDLAASVSLDDPGGQRRRCFCKACRTRPRRSSPTRCWRASPATSAVPPCYWTLCRGRARRSRSPHCSP